jgi:hypothetical protein
MSKKPHAPIHSRLFAARLIGVMTERLSHDGVGTREITADLDALRALAHNSIDVEPLLSFFLQIREIAGGQHDFTIAMIEEALGMVPSPESVAAVERFETRRREFQKRQSAATIDHKIASLAARSRDLIAAARREGLAIDDGNVVDLIADNVTSNVTLAEIRMALVAAGFTAEFPRATAQRGPRDGA